MDIMYYHCFCGIKPYVFGKGVHYTSLRYYWHIHICLVLCIFHRFGMVGHRQL